MSKITEAGEQLLRKRFFDLDEVECADCGETVYAGPDEDEISCEDHL